MTYINPNEEIEKKVKQVVDDAFKLFDHSASLKIAIEEAWYKGYYLGRQEMYNEIIAYLDAKNKENTCASDKNSS